MFVGHFGLAAAVKATQPRVPLWSLMLATQFLDVVFVVLYLAGGIESFHAVAPGTYGEALIDASYTHSLLGALLLSALYGGLAAWRWGRRAGWVLGAERDYLGAKLQAIWEDQRAFNLLLRQPPKSDEELTDQARDFVLWTESELHELLRVLPWKKHRRLPMRNNHAHLEEEGVDVLKYVLSILQLIGFETLDQVVDAYWRKTAVVRQRYREEWTSKIDRPCVICDIDNVLCDYISGMITWLADHDLIAPANVERLRAERPFMNAEAVGVPNDLWQRWKHRFRVEGAKRKLPVFDDARDFLRRMKDRGQQVVLLTSRPIDQYPNIFTDTILWLNENDLPYDFVWWSLDKAERVMQIEGFRQHVQFAVDDDRRYVDQFASVGIPTFWLQRNGPQSSRVNLMVAQVNSLQEIV